MTPLCDCVVKRMISSIPPYDLLQKLKQLGNYWGNILTVLIFNASPCVYLYQGQHFGYKSLNWSKKLHNINV